jgi:hypothetical protein
MNNSFHDKVKDVICRLNPRLEELADGCVELVDVDEERRIVRIRLFGGRIH